MTNTQYKAFLSSYMHFCTLFADIDTSELRDKGMDANSLYDSEKFKALSPDDQFNFIFKENLLILDMLENARKANFNLLLIHKTRIISSFLKRLSTNYSQIAKHGDTINNLFLDVFFQFKFKDFCECMDLERKQFKVVNASEHQNYCEIMLDDPEQFDKPIMIYSGDFISRKKMFDKPMKEFELTIDGDHLLAYYLTIFYINYNNEFIRISEERNFK